MAGEEEEEVHREVIEETDEEKEQRTQLAEELESFILNKKLPKKTFSMNADLDNKQKEAIKALFRGNVDSFTYKSADMLGIDPQIMSHKLNVYSDAKSVNQKKKKFRAKKREATRSKVEKLV